MREGAGTSLPQIAIPGISVESYSGIRLGRASVLVSDYRVVLGLQHSAVRGDQQRTWGELPWGESRKDCCLLLGKQCCWALPWNRGRALLDWPQGPISYSGQPETSKKPASRGRQTSLPPLLPSGGFRSRMPLQVRVLVVPDSVQSLLSTIQVLRSHHHIL